MFPSNPGPNSTVSGLPVSATGSPGRIPEVSSYTWTTVFSPRIWMTSPMSCSVPTSMTSYMRGFTPMAVTTGPATRWIVPVPLISVVTFALAATSPPHLKRSTPIARFTFVRRSSSSAAPTAITTGRATVSSRRHIELLRPFMSAVSRTKMPTSGSSRTAAIFFSISSRELVMARRTPTSLKPWTKSSRPTAAISISHHQQFPDHVDREPAFLPAGDEPDVLGLAVFAEDVIEDREDGQGVEMRVPRGLGQVNLLHFPEQGADAGRLDALEVARDLRVKGILAQAGHEGGLVKPNHLVQFVLRRLVPAREEDLAIERRLGRPDPEERLQIDEVDLALDELPHEAVRFRRWRDRLKEVGVVEPGDPVLPGGPLGDSGRALAQSRQGLRVDGSLESLERLIEVRRLDELPEEFDGETAGRHEVFLDFFGRCPVDLRANDGLDVLEVVSIQVAANDRSELALAEIVDVVVCLREVSGRCHLDEVHAGIPGPEGEHLGLVLPLPKEPGDLGDLHLEHA